MKPTAETVRLILVKRLINLQLYLRVCLDMMRFGFSQLIVDVLKGDVRLEKFLQRDTVVSF